MISQADGVKGLLLGVCLEIIKVLRDDAFGAFESLLVASITCPRCYP